MSDFNDLFNNANYRFNWGEPGGAFLNIFGSLGNSFGGNNPFAQPINGFLDMVYNRAVDKNVVNPNYNPEQPSGILGNLGLFRQQQQQQRPAASQLPQMSQTGQQASQGANSYGVDLMTRDYTNPFQQRQAAWEKLRNAR